MCGTMFSVEDKKLIFEYSHIRIFRDHLKMTLCRAYSRNIRICEYSKNGGPHWGPSNNRTHTDTYTHTQVTAFILEIVTHTHGHMCQISRFVTFSWHHAPSSRFALGDGWDLRPRHIMGHGSSYLRAKIQFSKWYGIRDISKCHVLCHVCDGQTDRQIDRQTDRQKDIHINSERYIDR